MEQAGNKLIKKMPFYCFKVETASGGSIGCVSEGVAFSMALAVPSADSVSCQRSAVSCQAVSGQLSAVSGQLSGCQRSAVRLSAVSCQRSAVSCQAVTAETRVLLSLWGLRWTKWHWERPVHEYAILPLSVLFCHYFMS